MPDTTPEPKIDYLISFLIPTLGNIGSMGVTLTLPVRTQTDLDVIADLIRQQNGLPPTVPVTILGFSRFEADAPAGAVE